MDRWPFDPKFFWRFWSFKTRNVQKKLRIILELKLKSTQHLSTQLSLYSSLFFEPFSVIELSKEMSAEWWCEYSRFMYCVVCVNRIPLRNLIWINRKVILFTSKFLRSGLIFSLKATEGLIISLVQSQWLKYAVISNGWIGRLNCKFRSIIYCSLKLSYHQKSAVILTGSLWLQ